ncbi:MAG: hypothetical protein JJU00_16645 [Opitutales bacterium]|nr:hypothetical protein [Opitutales bacterium]
MTTTRSHVPAVANAPPPRAIRFREPAPTYTIAAPTVQFVVATPAPAAATTTAGGLGSHWETFRVGGFGRRSILPKERVWSDGLLPGGY